MIHDPGGPSRLEPDGHLTDDRLIDLASELLSTDERTADLQHVKRCSSCEERLRRLVADHETIKASSRPESGLDRRDAARRRARRWTWAAAAAAAAAVLVFLALLPRWTGYAEDDVLQAWIPTDRARAVYRLTATPGEKQPLDEALRAYDSRDARRALNLLQAAEVAPDLEEIRRLYLASALVLEGHPAKAAAMLEKLDVPTMPQPDRAWAKLTLYCAQRQLGRDGPADDLLAELVAEPGRVGEIARDESEKRRRRLSPEAR